MAKVIVITSGKGGVGKTTSAINIGAAMNHFGGDVLIVDANLSTPNIGIQGHHILLIIVLMFYVVQISHRK